MTNCTSCGANLQSADIKSEFKCPNCSKTVIGRCQRCKKLSRVYTCPECKWQGP